MKSCWSSLPGMRGDVGGAAMRGADEGASAAGVAVDPVCGMTVEPERAAGSAAHGGRIFYFCSPSCWQKFRAEPERYLQPDSPTRTTPPAAPLVEYTCPMHPEVRRMGPGHCPICGMALEPVVATGEEANPELRDMTRRLWVSAALTAPILAMMVSGWLPGDPLRRLLGPGLALWLQAALATPVVVWGGWPFFVRGWASVATRHLNMFTLIALGTGASYLYSLVALLAPAAIPPSFRDMSGEPALYFEPAAVIVTLVLLGQVLELRARARTGGALRALLDLSPRTARVVRADGREEDVPLGEVAAGDRLRVRPGEIVPVDGVVLAGSSAVDESMVSGEPMPVAKAAGSPVTGGTLNGSGGLLVEARRVGADTLLAQIVRLVGAAQRSRAPIQRLADRVAAWFVPAVIAVALLTFAAWALWGPPPRLAHALVNAVAVLIIACPCALGLATPMSIMVGTGRGARAGILIRRAEALETLERVDTLVVDKTGTLTAGKPKLTDVEPLPGVPEQELLRVAACLEQASEHPLAAAVIAGARERGVEPAVVEDFRSFPGEGVIGTVAVGEMEPGASTAGEGQGRARAAAVGNARLLARLALDPGPLAARAEALRQEGRTVMFVAAAGRLLGLIAVADPLKPSAPEAVEALHREGLRVVMATGDGRATAAAVARALGLRGEDEVIAEVLPAEKADVVRRLQAAGRVVAMAGDGVNDAPALAQADVGIAMGTGTDVAMESAGITLLRGDLRGIVQARRLSRATMRNIRQNLFFAFVYNLLGVPVAAGALYPFFGRLLSPMMASAAMTFSSVSVIANALRLRRLEL
jgi:Cu+-exporting ATPase